MSGFSSENLVRVVLMSQITPDAFQTKIISFLSTIIIILFLNFVFSSSGH